MNDNFVIVIEADNKRAHAAYLKGLADLELIWPQVEEFATRKDAEDKAKRDEENARDEAEIERLQGIVDEYKREEYKREFRKCTHVGIFSVPRMPPPRPFSAEVQLSVARQRLLNRDFYSVRSRMDRFNSIRSELKHMADVAGAATGPFRMTEHQVREMVGWEDGSRIDQIKAQIGEVKP